MMDFDSFAHIYLSVKRVFEDNYRLTQEAEMYLAWQIATGQKPMVEPYLKMGLIVRKN